MIMIRDLRLTVVASLMFEIYELSFKHMLPNFAECWWDSLVLDFLVCNGFGILCGYWWLKAFKCTEYNFLGSVEVTDAATGEKRWRWKPLVSFRFFVGPLVVLLCAACIELNAFFLKFIFWVPAPHHLNLLRVIFWWLLGCAGTRELYYKMQNPEAPLGMMISLLFLLGALESIICFKMSAGLFPTPMPLFTKVAWVLALSGLALFAALYYPIQHHKRQHNKETIEPVSSAAEGAPVNDAT